MRSAKQHFTLSFLRTSLQAYGFASFVLSRGSGGNGSAEVLNVMNRPRESRETRNKAQSQSSKMNRTMAKNCLCQTLLNYLTPWKWSLLRAQTGVVDSVGAFDDPRQNRCSFFLS